MAKVGKKIVTKKKRKISVKEMKFRNDPMVRFYDKTQEWLQESGRPVIIGVAVVAGLVLLYTAGSYLFSYRDSKAEKALASALEIYNAQVVETPPANPVGKIYTNEKLKWQDAADAFDKLAKDYSSQAVMAHYYEGCADLHIDKDKGARLLDEVVAKNNQPTSDLARLALAQYYLANGDASKAVDQYQKLVSSKFLPKQVVELGLGHAYEKAGNNPQAVDAYFDAAQIDRSSGAGSEAEKRLTALAPDKVKDLPPPNAPGS